MSETHFVILCPAAHSELVVVVREEETVRRSRGASLHLLCALTIDSAVSNGKWGLVRKGPARCLPRYPSAPTNLRELIAGGFAARVRYLL